MPFPSRRRLRPAALAAALLLACAAQAQTARVAVDIAPAPLDRALGQLARQAGVQILFSSALAQRHEATALRGEFTAQEALQRLLAGSGLVVRARDAATFTVEPAPPASSATPLAEVQVVAQADTSGATEGTGSYTTTAVSTATKLSLSLRETPQSATVITRQRMDDQAMVSIVDVVKNTPGLFLSSSDGVGRPN